MTQKEKLLKAIELAQGPGKCLYVVDGEPCCVVGQLAALENIPASFFDGVIEIKVGSTTFEYERNGRSIDVFSDLLAKLDYNEKMLERLQNIWDFSGKEDVETCKQQMRDIVNEYFPG